ncbi:MAG TPA: malto-oligosyltrehalose synthase [Vicinamibacterales bacterium]|nr:malto-oligosyltrehalose synthase [Vicinamibacterales bacterium]
MSTAAPERPPYVPTSTYRLQVHVGFPLPAAAAVSAYLARLGIGTCYTAPYFTAAAGSTHGYDVSNHNEINPELGGEPAHRQFIEALKRHGLGHLVDFVPNHMGIAAGGNAWWTDVLENGPSSPTAKYFDIDWAPMKAELHAKLLLPILGDQYGQVLERGELQLGFRDGGLILQYADHELPINPRQAPRVYRKAVEPLTTELGVNNPVLHEFLSILASLENMPAYTEQAPARITERQREKEVAKARLSRLVQESPVVGRQIAEAVRQTNGIPGRPDTFDALHTLLESQPYRLAYWRTASHEINYRRFFDVNTLAGLRVEEHEVFEATHALLARLLRDGSVQGVRIDHPDGLFDPQRYFEMLQGLGPVYVVAEKILSGRERLPRSWPVHGTTGYDFLNDLNGVFIDAGQARRLRRAYTKLTGGSEPFDDVLYDAKQLIMSTAMSSELNVLAHMLDRIGESNRKSRDFTLDSLRDVIREVVACFPVYRTYVNDQGWTPDDRAVVEQAITRARRRNPAMESSLFDFFREVVLPRDPDDAASRQGVERRGGYPPADANEARARLRFAMKLQQYTGPVQAKGLEDTAFYRYNVLLSVNEVGGDPARLGRGVEDFHESNAHRAREWPFDMITTATHDTKLGEDVRARINLISEMPDEWAREVSKWMRINRPHRQIVDGDPAPDRNDEYRLYQVLLGAWPTVATAPDEEFIERVAAYMLKAAREAKVHTSWLTANLAYEEALTGFVRRILGASGGPKFLPAFLPFQQRIGSRAVVNSLSQLVLKLGSPGVPDFYQGTELWDLSLVDPDNRRPVDFATRESLLDEFAASPPDPGELLANWPDGRIKLFITRTGLHLRREMPDVFVGGDYLPLAVESSVPGDAVAFARISGEDAVLVIAPRLCSGLAVPKRPAPLGGDCWKTSRVMLPDAVRNRVFRNIFTGADVRPIVTPDSGWIFLGQALDTLPVAMLKAV